MQKSVRFTVAKNIFRAIRCLAKNVIVVFA